MTIPTRDECRQSMQEVDRLKAVVDRTMADLNRWTTLQERVVRAEAHYRAMEHYFRLLDRLERSGVLLYSEIFAAYTTQQGTDQEQKAS